MTVCERAEDVNDVEVENMIDEVLSVSDDESEELASVEEDEVVDCVLDVMVVLKAEVDCRAELEIVVREDVVLEKTELRLDEVDKRTDELED